MVNSNWLFGKKADLTVLFIPVWLCWGLAFLLPDEGLYSDVPLWIWVLVVIGIDVSHVWSSIFRTYLEKDEFLNHKQLLVLAPILSFSVSFGLAFISIDLFWRCLAYVAVYHFVKQQFGFMRIYKARAGDFIKKKLNDNFIIYLSMLYPVIYWHLSPQREFEWFVEGDFISVPFTISSGIFHVTNATYFFLLTAWLVEEVWLKMKGKIDLSIGKILWVLTTAGNWYIGIVHFNSDLVFTITNVVAHGVPYLALVVFYKARKREIQTKTISYGRNIRIGFTIIAVVLFLGLTEEYLWDLLVYRENVAFFSAIVPYFSQSPGVAVQLLAIGFLAVPQVTHYIIDGFIWKNSEKNPHIKSILLE